MNCTLCGAETKTFWKSKNREFVVCTNCEGIQLLPEFYINKEAEKQRYLTHNNDVEDPRYQEFVSPITSRVLNDFSAKNTGLDYGCGTGPVATSELEKQGYSVALFDPYFYPDKSVLKNFYDFIICCEVMEHFHDPAREFRDLSYKLNPGGKLYCKTSLYTEGLDFDTWYYKNDPTHVFFYTEKSLIWIRDNFGFSKLELESKLMVFSK
ncbi:class I SAM-dependent methyltransferase [Salegentibacter sediminis]|uniref:class I SAM-dependent methyltransferase n=1 Tax=Salegentibacter sediminis TaxID=1930251 RepID=UPI0009C1291C|nr:class I SAM-dependent methyltransferase [Salegentibacter sediminis]